MAIRKRLSVFPWNEDVGYREEAKAAFLKAAKTRLATVAKELKLPKDSYDLRVNQGGIAVSGEVTLHHEEFYIQISQNTLRAVLVRTCKGRKDYTGGQNQWINMRFLDDMSQFIRLLYVAVPRRIYEEAGLDLW